MDTTTIKHADTMNNNTSKNWILGLTSWIIQRGFSLRTFNLYKRITKDHPKISTIGLSLLYVLIIVILFKITYTFLKYNGLFPVVPEIEHIDMAALLCAILSIIIAFLITIYVEENHTEQTESLKEGSRSIKDATDNIENVTKEMWNILAALAPKKSLFERLNAIEEIIDITKESQIIAKQHDDPELQNRLYILNYSASYGHLQSFNASITLGDEGYKSRMPGTWIEYHELFKYYNNRQAQIFNKLLSLDKKSVNIALLRTKVNHFKNQVDKFERLLNKVLLENSEQKTYSYFECDTGSFDIMKGNERKSDIYAVPLSLSENHKINNSANEEERHRATKIKLIGKLCKYNKERIETLNDSGVVEKIAYLDYVPFQFYLTAPRNRNKSSKQKCLLVFTNILHPTITVSFVSDNEILIQTLMDIHSTLTSDYESREFEKQKLTELFNCADTEPVFVLTKIFDQKNYRDEKTDLAYLSDYAAYADLKELFSDRQIVNATIQFNDELTVEKIEKQSKTFIVIGLFGNSISEKLRFIEGQNKSCFMFSRTKEGGDGKAVRYTDELIRIHDDGGSITIDGRQWKEFPRTNGRELALLAKVKVGESTVIICGGLTGYGTGIIGKYIRENIGIIEDRIGTKNLKGESFAVIFSMPWIDKNGNEYDNTVIKQIVIEGIFKHSSEESPVK